ncbi:MAG: hypothetical protein Q4F97_07850 [Bacteroidales bacterium]|nr:hypothetical protein [Bacteroidales bacterium]
MIKQSDIESQLRYSKNDVSSIVSDFLDSSPSNALCNRYNYYGHFTLSVIILDLNSNNFILFKNRETDVWGPIRGHINSESNSFEEAVKDLIDRDLKINPDCLIPLNIIDGETHCLEIHSSLIDKIDLKNETTHYHHELRFIIGYAGSQNIKLKGYNYSNYQWISFKSDYSDEYLNSNSLKDFDQVIYNDLIHYKELNSDNSVSLSLPFAKYEYESAYKYFDEEDYDKAIYFFSKSIESYKNVYNDEFEFSPEIFNPSMKPAECFLKQNNPSEAVNVYLNTLNLFKEFSINDTDNYYWYIQLELYVKIGRVYASLNNKEMALYYFERAKEYLNKSNR